MLKCDICDAEVPAGSASCPVCGNNVSGVSQIDPTAATPAHDEDDSRTSHTSSSSSRSASVSTSLASIYMRSVGSSSISVAASNLGFANIASKPKRRAGGGSRSVTTSVLGCGIVNVDPVDPGDAVASCKTRDEVSVQAKDRFCENDWCTGDPADAVDRERSEDMNDRRMKHDPTCPDELKWKGGAFTPVEFHEAVKLEGDHCFCDFCGAEHWFVPALEVSDRFGEIGSDGKGIYEVLGYIARGGFGNVYLVYNHKLKRKCAVKSVASANNPVQMQAAVEERRFLVELDHPNLVKVYDFVEHGSLSYIVMQYVPGKSLKTMLKEYLVKKQTMPVTLILSYMIGMMTAFKYLRKKGIVCRDFKLDNVMVYEDNIVMIDFGAFIQINEQQPGNVIYTEGYAPPEVLPVDKDGNNCFGLPAVFDYPSDLFTVIRSVAIACVDDRQVKRTAEELKEEKEKQLRKRAWFKLARFAFDIPSSDDVQDFAKYPSFQRLLVKGLRKNPEDRFQDTDELSEAMLGVLREVHCQNQWFDDKQIHARHVDSQIFSADPYRGDHDFTWRDLPSLKVDPRDKGGSVVTAQTEKHLEPADELAAMEHERGVYPQSIDIPLRIARLLVELGRNDKTDALVAELVKDDPYDFRLTWTRMLSYLAQSKIKEARECAEAVYAELPGEIAPKLAVAYCAELESDWQSAVALYNLITICDVTYPSAAFGLSRSMLAFKKAKSPAEARDAAAEALSRIPSDRSAYPYGVMQLARVLSTIEPGLEEFVEASTKLAALTTDGFDIRRVRADVLKAAVDCLRRGSLKPAPDATIFGRPVGLFELQLAAGEQLRGAAQVLSGNSANKRRIYDLIVEANQIEPMR